MLAPCDAAQVLDAVAAAAAAHRTIEIRCGGSKVLQGAPVMADATMELGGLNGIVDYSPEELVLTARPGTPLTEIGTVLSGRNQHLAFEPSYTDAGATLGGAVLANDSGPRRITAGAARDHVLGLAAVSGRGESFKSGGRVVKNVTGYDLPKLISGSWGTLAVVTELTVKLVPAPEAEMTTLIFGLGASNAVQAMAAALATPHEVSGLAHIPSQTASCSQVDAVAGAGTAVTALRVEGAARSVDYRVAALQQLLPGSESVILDANASQVLWAEIRDAVPLQRSAVLWQLAVPPAFGADVATNLAAADAEALFLFDWAGGRVWMGLSGAEAKDKVIHEAAHSVGGYARLMRAPESVRSRATPFPPLATSLAALQLRVKEAFDPLGILNPGRMGVL